MPLLTVTTNTAVAEDSSRDFIVSASKLVSELLGKPESYVMVQLTPGRSMSFAGSLDPLAYCELKSIGLPEDRSQEFSQRLCRLLEDKLAIPAARTYIEFSNAARHLWGWNGGTF